MTVFNGSIQQYFNVSSQHVQAKLCISVDLAFSLGSVESPTVAALFGLIDTDIPSSLHPTIYLSGPGVYDKPGEPVGQGSGTTDMVAVTVEIKGDTFTNVRVSYIPLYFVCSYTPVWVPIELVQV